MKWVVGVVMEVVKWVVIEGDVAGGPGCHI